jgi:hypothetical protein
LTRSKQPRYRLNNVSNATGYRHLHLRPEPFFGRKYSEKGDL